jgi:uncharacterized protein (DUF58 family)
VVTRTGAGLGLGGVACYALGVALGYPALTALGAAGVLAVVASLVAVASRLQLEASRELRPARAPVGEPVRVHLRVRNRASRAAPRLTAVDPVAGRRVEVALPPVPGGGEVEVEHELPPLPRGVYDVGPLSLHRSDLLGLAAASRRVGGAVRLWVHPRVHPLSTLPATRTRSLEGATVEVAPRGTATFHAVREYTTGDDVRHIHWRSTARTGQLMVREYIDTNLPDLTLVIDDRAGVLHDDGFETAVEVTASLAVATIDGGFPLRLVGTTGRPLAVPGGRASREEVLDELAALTPAEGVGDPWLPLDDRSSRGQVAVVVTGASDDDEQRLLVARLGRYAAAWLVLVEPGGGRSEDLGSVQVVSCRSGAHFAEEWDRWR